jgi:uncharacterized protein (TIGR02246 family)
MHARILSLLSALPLLAAACAGANDTATTADSAAGVATATTADAGQARQAIEAANAKFADALKRGDTTAAVAENYADDAIVMAPGAEAWRGREAVRKGWAGMITAMPAKEVSVKTDDVMVGGDLVVESGTYEMTLQPPGGREVKEKGKYVVVWKRQADGTWKIVRDVFNSDTPPAKS